MKNKAEIKKVMTIAWPAVLESFFIAVVGLVDAFMVSSVGAYAVAAIGITTQPKFIALAAFVAFKVAVSALIARRKGEKNQKGANQILLMALVCTVVLGVFMTILCLVFAEPLMVISGSNPDTHESAVLYFRIIMSGMMFMIITMVINGAQRGAGKTKIALRTNLVSNVVNLICNYLLIGGQFGFPELGVKGAAIATVLGTMVACGMSIASLFNKESFISFHYIMKEKIRLCFEPTRNLFKIGATVFVEQILIRIGFMLVVVMAAKLGTEEFAAHQVGMNILGISFAFGDGMQVAALALIGQSLGEGKPDEAKLFGKICTRIGMLMGAVLSITYLLCGRFLYEQFFVEEAIVSLGVQIITAIIFIVLLQIPQVIYMGCLRGAGDVVFTTITITVSTTIVRPFAGYFMCYVLGWGMIGLWLGILVDQLLRLVLTSMRFNKGAWTKIKI